MTKNLSEPTSSDCQDKTEKVLPGEDWKPSYVVFSRSGFTDSARELGAKVGMILVDLETLEAGLRDG